MILFAVFSLYIPKIPTRYKNIEILYTFLASAKVLLCLVRSHMQYAVAV